jgi:hypothetical protein
MTKIELFSILSSGKSVVPFHFLRTQKIQCNVQLSDPWCLRSVSLNTCLMGRQSSLPEILAVIVFPLGFNSWDTKDTITFLAICVVRQRGPSSYTDHSEEIKTSMTEPVEGKGTIHVSHCRRVLRFFKCKLRVWLDSQPSLQPLRLGISEMSACVKITSGLCGSHSSMFLHKDRGTRPCLCSGDRSAFMSDITLHRRGQVGVRAGGRGPCLLTEPWVQL